MDQPAEPISPHDSFGTRATGSLGPSGGTWILHEALTAGPDPLHLALVFNLSYTTASRYATIAQHLLDANSSSPASR